MLERVKGWRTVLTWEADTARPRWPKRGRVNRFALSLASGNWEREMCVCVCVCVCMCVCVCVRARAHGKERT